MVPVSYYLVLSAALFVIGVVGVLVRRHVLAILMALQLMLTAANLSWVALARARGDLDGQVVALFALAVAAVQLVVGLALVVALFRNRKTADVGEVDLLKW